MILEFKMKNVYSYKDEVTYTMLALKLNLDTKIIIILYVDLIF